MRRTESLNTGWRFTGPDGREELVDLPHTWNAADGQDGGSDYLRGVGVYRRSFPMPAHRRGEERVYLEFRGANSSAKVELNGQAVTEHHGGYSTFRADVTDLLAEHNFLTVAVDNAPNDMVYPQKADFTFYGGLYRDVLLRIVPAEHFDLDYYGGEGVTITAAPDGSDGVVRVESFYRGEGLTVRASILNAHGREAAAGEGSDVKLRILGVHLWDGVFDPYLYTAVVRLCRGETVVDEVRMNFGVRSFRFDPQGGFYLNGRPYPLRGVARHQDWKGIGNALTKEHHDRDMALIKEIGANAIRLAHYQHDQYFYDLCDKFGMVVWAEIPYISEHLPGGRENTLSQMHELIVQNHHHPSIVTWGLSNEITIATKATADMLDNHRALNDLVHRLDPTRPTTLACYALCAPTWRVVHLSDIVGYNLYLGWYVPGLRGNDLFLDFFHRVWPNRCIGYSEYGAEGMPNLHSSKPRRGDHSEEYQAVYHEYLLSCFARRPWLWGTFVWNMFDFAADARDQGGEPGMNHKGLVTFDRQIKKDSFYLYKAWWSTEPFVHICSKRYVDRPEDITTVKVYSNQSRVTLYADGTPVGEGSGCHVFTFRVPLRGTVELKAVAGESTDTARIRHVERPNPAYRLGKSKKKSQNWV